MALNQAAAFSDTMEGAILRWFQGLAFPTAPTTLYVGLFTTNPADNGTFAAPSNGSEVTITANTSTGYAAYVRQAITTSSGWSSIGVSTGDATGQQISNAAQINFPSNGNTSLAVTATGVGIWDAATGGNLYFYIPFTSVQTIAVGTPLQIAAGALVIQVD